MKIAIASDDERTIARHTGRCRGFVVFEIADGQAARCEYRANRFTAHARGQCSGAAEEPHAHSDGHHCHSSLRSALGDCCALITGGMGPRLVADLARQGIDACVCDVADVDAAALEFAAGRLARLDHWDCSRR